MTVLLLHHAQPVLFRSHCAAVSQPACHAGSTNRHALLLQSTVTASKLNKLCDKL